MGGNFFLHEIFLHNKEQLTNILALTHHNKTELSSVSIDISLSQHALFVFKLILPYTFRQNVFPLMSILLTGYLQLFYQVRHLFSAYMVNSLLIHKFEFLDVLLMLLMFMFFISSLLVPKNVFFLVILLAKRLTSYMISNVVTTSFTTIDLVIPNVVLDNPSSATLPYTPPPPTKNTIVPPTNSPLVIPLRRSQRSHGPFVALRDYICNQVVSPSLLSSSSSFPNKGTRYPPCNFISYDYYTPQHRSFIATILLMILNLHVMNKLFLTLIGKRQCNLNWLIWRPIILGLLQRFLLERKLLVLVGYIKSSANLMVLNECVFFSSLSV